MADDRDDLDAGLNDLHEHPSDDRRNAFDAVKAPAICMIVVGVLSILLGCYQFISLLGFDTNYDAQIEMRREMSKNKPQQQQDADKMAIDMMEKFRGGAKIGILTSGVFWVVVGAIVILGGIQMIKLQSRGLVTIATVLTIIPCFAGCCLVSMPIGIWSWVVLSKPSVKRAFR